MLHRGSYPLLAGVFAALLANAATAAEPTPLATASVGGIGVAIGVMDRSFMIGSTRITARGALGGVYTYWQSGGGFRLEARTLWGTLDYEVGAAAQAEPVTSWGVRGTWGVATAARQRVYVGVGATGLSGDSPFGDGDIAFRSVYIPIGLARSGVVSPGWRALVTIEGRFLAKGGVMVDGIVGNESVEFDRSGGFGLAVSIQFSHVPTGLSIAPYLRYVEPGASETVIVNGNRLRIDDAEVATAGVRLTWRY